MSRIRRRLRNTGAVLFAGQSYYHTWYLSRALRSLGWRADVLNWDDNEASQAFYHGQDYRLRSDEGSDVNEHLKFLERTARFYDIVHFSNAHGMKVSPLLESHFRDQGNPGGDVDRLRAAGVKIVYSNNGCLDGVAQSSFSQWGDRPVCLDCPWRTQPSVCSDERNLAWGRFRNERADFQTLAGGNRADFNVDPRIHEVPEFYCLDEDFWRPGLEVPARFRLDIPEPTLRIYHAVGNFDLRTDPATQRNIKSTHIYVPLIEDLKREGHDVELVFCHDVPSRDVRFFQVQSDIVVDMLTFGWFGANIREAMMLGKPCVCFIRPEWLEQVREELPEYAAELPVVSATPDTVREVLIGLINDPGRRREIGARSRAFALKWHSADAGARRFDTIYRSLMQGGADAGADAARS